MSGLQQPMEHPNVSVSYFVMHFAMSVSKRLFCTCTCDFVPHLDVFVYKSLCRTYTGRVYSSLCFTCTVDVCVQQQPVLCQKVSGLYWRVFCTWMYEDQFNSSLGCAIGGVWPTAAFANLIDVAVYCAAPVVHAFYAGPGRITKLLFYRKPF